MPYSLYCENSLHPKGCRTIFFLSWEKKVCPSPCCCPKRKRRCGASKSWTPHNPMCISPILLLSWKNFMRVSCWSLGIKKILLCWLYSRKLKKKSSFQREKDQGRRRIFFLMHSLEEEVLLLFFFYFFNKKIRLDLIFNI